MERGCAVAHVSARTDFCFLGGRMTIAQMIGQSGILTLLGMGVVFLFLVIMIVCMNLLHLVLHALHLDTAEPASKQAAPAAGPVPQAPAQDTLSVVAAIAAAVREKQSV